jgi:hypothetical protein
MHRARLRNPVEDSAEMTDRLVESPFPQGELAQSVTRDSGKRLHDVLKLLASILQPIQPQINAAQMHGRFPVVRLRAAHSLKVFCRLLQPASLLIEIAKQVAPSNIVWRQTRRSAVGGLGSIEELIGVEDLGQRSVRVGAASVAKPHVRRLLDLPRRRLKLFGDRAVQRVQGRKRYAILRHRAGMTHDQTRRNEHERARSGAKPFAEVSPS